MEPLPILSHSMKRGVALAGLMKTAMAPLLEWAELLVPEDRWAATPLFLFGTAGTRQLPEKDRVRLLDHLNDILNASSFRSLSPVSPLHIMPP